LGWIKRVISFVPIEKPCQLMIAFALFVTLSALPCAANVAPPETTVGPVGLALACSTDRAKAAATESAG